MGNKTKNKEQRSPVEYDFKAKSKELLRKYQHVANALLDEAVELVDNETDFRSNKKRPGLGAILHAAGQAMNEVQRLYPLVGELSPEDLTRKSIFDGVDFTLPVSNASTANN